MPKIQVYGHVNDGKLTIDNRKRLEEGIRRFRDGTVKIIITRRAVRSNPQNSYYWAVIVQEVYLRMMDLGNEVTEEVVHEYLKMKFNPQPIHDADGIVIDEIPGSTTEMNKEEFSEYIEKIIRWAAEILDIVIPYPKENYESKI